MLLYDAAHHGSSTALGTSWRLAVDQVMGGRSTGKLSLETIDGQLGLVIRGHVRLENNGGFIQMNVDLSGVASEYSGVRVRLRGDGGPLVFLAKTFDLERPWQSYRRRFDAPGAWTDHRIRWDELEPYRTARPFAWDRLRRIGIAAIGREGPAFWSLTHLELISDELG